MKKIQNIKVNLLLIISVICLLTGCTKSLEEQIAEQLELGQKYLAELNYEEAIVAFTKAIELDEKTEAAYIGLAEAYEGRGDVWQATQTLETGYELFPEENMKNLLAETYKRALEFFVEDMERQREIYDRLIELFPDEEYYQKLAEIYKMQEKVEEAKKILEDGIIATDSEELKEKLEELNGSEIITVDGIIRFPDEIPEYQEKETRYYNQYCSGENNIAFWSEGYLLRFFEPVQVTIEGELVSVSEASVAYRKQDISMKIHETRGQAVRLTGHFIKKEWEGEFTGPHYDEDSGEYYYYYDPTGPYMFHVDELTLISQ